MGATRSGQAAAAVAKDGTLQHGKGVVAVHRTGAGRYSITLESHINATGTVPQTTLNQSADWRGEIFTKIIDNFTIGVLTGVNGAAADEPFYLLVP
ncbi:hypothetical protein ACFWTE_18050 [Nocardiopsis sp. NPDC058631]|uniref:hypothetical protein n=1 Tax=Nocardiopsis sp. NPDC058631 TaxID=3346566 RepID=UPI00365D6220